jgi:hypothetical protein
MDSTLATTSGDIEVIAETPQEMKESNNALIAWCEQKIKAMRTDFIELDAAYKAAVARKWKSSVLKRHALMAKKRIEFYHKIQTALVAGFYIVPNFPVHVFAIRTKKNAPLRVLTVTKQSYRPYPSKDQQTGHLSEGEGDYVSPFPEVEALGKSSTDSRGAPTTEWTTWASHWKEIDFPLCMARPRIMEAVGRAMEIKVFDDLGVLSSSPDRRRGCGDPIIVARLLDPRSTSWNKRFVSFIIAWSLDTRTI